MRTPKPLDLGARDIDSVELALESAGVGGKFYGNERTAHPDARGGCFHLRHIKAEVVKDPAHPAYPRFHAIFDRVKRRHLPALDLIERGLQAAENIVDALDLGELIRLCVGDDRRARFQARLTIRRRHKNHGIADRGRFWGR